MKRAKEVGVHCDPGLLGEGGRGGVLVGNAGIVHQDVQTAVGRLHMLPKGGNVLGAGNVQLGKNWMEPW